MGGIMIVNRLPQLLSQRNISIRELARLTGVTYSTIWALYHMERRSLQFGVLESICRVLEVQPGDIYSYSATKEDSFPKDWKVEPAIPKTISEEVSESREKPTPAQRSEDWRSW